MIWKWLYGPENFPGLSRNGSVVLKDRERYGTGDKAEKLWEICKWNTNFHWELFTGKTGLLPFQKFRLFRKISSGTNQKVGFHLHPNRNFRSFFENGKRLMFLGWSLRNFWYILKDLKGRNSPKTFQFHFKLFPDSVVGSYCTLFFMLWRSLFQLG